MRAPDVALHRGVGLGQEVLRPLHAEAAGALEAVERHPAGREGELAAEGGAGVEVGAGGPGTDVDVHGITPLRKPWRRAAMRPSEMPSATRSSVG